MSSLADGRAVLLGALGLDCRVEVDGDRLHGLQHGAACPWYVAVGAPREVLDGYAAMLPSGRRRAAGNVWCSWYSHYRDISERRVLQVARALRGLPFQVLQIDDGWQQHYGDWLPNERFGDMAVLARRIRASGFTPGLWLAPFLVHPESRAFREHAAWLLRDENGAARHAAFNDGCFWYALDASQPTVVEWAAERVAEARAWGFSYLKLDYLYAAALPGSNPRLPREQVYHRAMARLRQAAGDAYLLACGAPILPTLGLVDGLRVGPDVAPFWEDEARTRFLHDASAPSAANALRTTLSRLWLRPLVETDPDVVYFRTRYNLLTRPQKHWLEDLAEVAGFKATSDPPDWLDASELRRLRAFLGRRARVRRLDETRFRIGRREVDFGEV